MELNLSGNSKNLSGNIRVPGDKSITHRALLFGALADGASHLIRPLRAGVVVALEDCLEALGVQIDHPNQNEVIVHGGRWRSPDRPLDCQNSGATMRFLLGALAGSQVSATLTGSRRLAQRPMNRVVEPLRQMGARIAGLNGADQPPLDIVGTHLHGIDYQMPVASAQVKTAILLAGVNAEGRTTIREPIASRDHSERLLRGLGVSIGHKNGTLSLEPIGRSLPSFELAIPGDFSAAAFLIAVAVLVPGSKLTLGQVGLNSSRTGLLEALRAMGVKIAVSHLDDMNGEPIGDLTVGFSEMTGVEVKEQQVVSMVDEIPILAVLATQAHGQTRIAGASELRLKESDRLSTMTNELRKMGAQIEEFADGISIEGPTPLTGTRLSSHGDHRVAMALGVAGILARGPTTVSGAEVIQQSFPGFQETLRLVGVDLR